MRGVPMRGLEVIPRHICWLTGGQATSGTQCTTVVSFPLSQRAGRVIPMRKRHHEETPALPEAGDTLPVVERRTRHTSGHPWVYRRMAGDGNSEIEPGTLVEVVDKTSQVVGRGF